MTFFCGGNRIRFPGFGTTAQGKAENEHSAWGFQVSANMLSSARVLPGQRALSWSLTGQVGLTFDNFPLETTTVLRARETTATARKLYSLPRVPWSVLQVETNHVCDLLLVQNCMMCI